jgi:hypothetical protein
MVCRHLRRRFQSACVPQRCFEGFNIDGGLMRIENSWKREEGMGRGEWRRGGRGGEQRRG